MNKGLIGLAAAAAAISGLAIGTAPKADAVPTNHGSCSGLVGLGKISPSLANFNQAVTVSNKGVPATVGGTNFGSCTFSSPVTGGGAVTKWGSKLTSPAADCISDTDATEYPLSGKLSAAFAATKLDSYVATTKINPSGAGADTVGVSGIVTKGDAVGTFVNGEIYFDPIVKDKLQTAYAPYPGYNYDLGNAIGCQDPSGATPAAITGIIIGDGTSPLLGSVATGLSFTSGI